MADINDLTFDKFKTLAKDDSLSIYEKIGFYNKFREFYEQIIFEDIISKLTNFKKKNQTIVDIGAGCSKLPIHIIDWCKKQQHTLILIDSKEMLDLLPDEDFIIKIPGKFPTDFNDFLEDYKGKVDVLLCYSVFHYIYEELPYMAFIDHSVELLAPEGQFLLGDLPNYDKRDRFFNSPNGIKFHQENNNTKEKPKIDRYAIRHNTIDDAVIFSILTRCRNTGLEAYLLPQNKELPMANRREDILIERH